MTNVKTGDLARVVCFSADFYSSRPDISAMFLEMNGHICKVGLPVNTRRVVVELNGKLESDELRNEQYWWCEFPRPELYRVIVWQPSGIIEKQYGILLPMLDRHLRKISGPSAFPFKITKENPDPLFSDQPQDAEERLRVKEEKEKKLITQPKRNKETN